MNVNAVMSDCRHQEAWWWHVVLFLIEAEAGDCNTMLDLRKVLVVDLDSLALDWPSKTAHTTKRGRFLSFATVESHESTYAVTKSVYSSNNEEYLPFFTGELQQYFMICLVFIIKSALFSKKTPYNLLTDPNMTTPSYK